MIWPFFIESRPPMPPNRRMVKSPFSLEFQLMEIAETKKAVKEKHFVETHEDLDDTAEEGTSIFRPLSLWSLPNPLEEDRRRTLADLKTLEESLLFWNEHKSGELTP